MDSPAAALVPINEVNHATITEINIYMISSLLADNEVRAVNRAAFGRESVRCIIMHEVSKNEVYNLLVVI